MMGPFFGLRKMKHQNFIFSAVLDVPGKGVLCVYHKHKRKINYNERNAESFTGYNQHHKSHSSKM